MSKNLFNHNVQLIPLNISNSTQDTFRMELMNIPYLLYEVEVLSTGEKIVINKPGGKRNFGRLAKNDFMVFIYSPTDEGLWLISHDEIKDDLLFRISSSTHSASLEQLVPNDIIAHLFLFVNRFGTKCFKIFKKFFNPFIWLLRCIFYT